jgi:psp operon transcriptional activator
MAANGKFRADLLDRLAFDVVTVPPLRARRDDIPLLADHFATRMTSELGRDFFPGFTDKALESLMRHDWPGNVRELRNAMERVAALGRRPVVAADELDFLRPRAAVSASVPTTDLPGAVERLERAMIIGALAETGGNRSEAARRLGIHRQRLHEKLRQYGLSESRTEGDRDPDVPPAD